MNRLFKTSGSRRRTGLEDFASIYQDFQPKIFRYLCRLSGEADAEDLTQTVFTKVSRSLGTFRGESSLATWIYRIATNTAHDHALSSSCLLPLTSSVISLKRAEHNEPRQGFRTAQEES